MRKIFTLATLLCLTLGASAQGIDFATGTWAEVLAKAKTAKKMVFVDVYTSWCGPCRKMAKETFTDASVGSFFNEKFINYKIDAEKGEGISIAKKYGVSAYPTCIFVTAEGELAYRFEGFRNVSALLTEGEKALGQTGLVSKVDELQKEYAAGKRDKAFLKEYVAALSASGHELGAPLTDYLKQLTDAELYSDEGLKYVSKITVYDAELFNRFKAYCPTAPAAQKENVQMAVMMALSNCLKPLMNGGAKSTDTEAFENMLAVKAATGMDDSMTQGLVGGGYAFFPAERLRITFYRQTDKAKFQTLFSAYMDDELKSGNGTKSQLQAYNESQKHIIDSLQAANDTLGVKKMKMASKIMALGMILEYKSKASFIVDNTSEYNTLQPSRQSVCAKWVNYAYHQFNSLDVARRCATALAGMNEKKQAKEILSDGIKRAKTDAFLAVSDKEMQAAEAQLKELE